MTLLPIVRIKRVSRRRIRAMSDECQVDQRGPSAVVAHTVSGPGGFARASAVNWSRRCRLRQLRGKPAATDVR